MRVDNLVVPPSQPAPKAVQGQTAATREQAVVVMRMMRMKVDHPVARMSL